MNSKFPTKPWRAFCASCRTMFLLAVMARSQAGFAATFSGYARVEVNDPAGGLSWNATNDALTVSCWFKLSIPSGTNLTENMTILANRRTGSQSDPHAYLIQFNILNGNIEFSSRGSSGLFTNTLIERPYLERWYHVAIVRQSSMFNCYVDGRSIPGGSGSAGDASGGDGVSIGGWGSGKYLYGEVQEVAVYQTARDQEFIVNYLFLDQPTNDPSLNLQGYYKLGFSTNSADNLRNFAPSGIPSGSTAGSGTVLCEEANQEGEQSAFDSRKNGGRDALSPLSGGFSWNQAALARPTPGIAFDLRFGYSSGNASGTYKLNNFDPYASGPLGKGGWRHSFENRVLPSTAFSPLGDADTIGVLSWDGAIETWDKDQNTGEYKTRDNEYKGEFTFTTTNCQWITPDRLIYVFKLPNSGTPSQMRGRLLSIRDYNNNAVQVLWNESSAIITQVVDTVRGAYSFNYSPAGQLTNINFQSWAVNFGYDSSNRITSKSLTNTSGLYAPVNTTWQFQYGSNGLLARIVDPRGNTNVFVQYDQYGRQTNQMDALNRPTITLYGVPGKRQITRTDAETNQWIETYDRKGHLLAQLDPLTNATSYTYDEHGNRTSITEPLGWTTYFGYDERANVIAKTNALNEVTQWLIHPFFNKPVQQITPQPPDTNSWITWTNFYAYDAAGNLTNNFDALGSLVSYAYYPNGLVRTSTDGNAHITSFTYDTNGFLYTQTDPATNTTTIFYNEVGWKTKELNALGQQTSYNYNLNGNAIRIMDALTRVFYRVYDACGNLRSVTDGKSKITTYGFDAANQRTNMIDRTGTNFWQFFYTLRGKLDHSIDPLAHSVTNVYDAANRLIRVGDPLGHWVTNQYDANGNLQFFFDKSGKRWAKAYDRLNRVQTDADPLGNTRETRYDSADRIYEIISPNTYPSFNTYDGRGRLITWRDPQNFPWHYDYDGVGNITNITDALGGHYVMDYGPRNERKFEQNQDTNVWQYTYDELLRLKQQTDPNQIVRTKNYDAGGRLRVVDFSTGRQDTFDYDDNDNLRVLSRHVSGSTTTVQMIYDLLDRIQEEDDANGQTVLYGHDPAGNVTFITYPGNKTLNNYYDALGRMTNQVDWANHQTLYGYDIADRLTWRTYPNGIVQTNIFNDAGRLTSLSYASPTRSSNSINVVLTYAYDRNGNKTGGGEMGTFAWPLPSLTDETSNFTPAGRIMSRVDALNATANFAYQFDKGGNMTNASGGGQSWTLTYDEDSHTTSIKWQVLPLTDRLVTNRYDAIGRRVSRIVDNVETRFVLDLHGSLERILCDADAVGNICAWYVHGPDLCYKVNATNGLTCYHADGQANIIALTDDNANLVAQYAYTPYGRSLGSTIFQSNISNPFLFVGSQGVTEELPGLYFMRARYYSADVGEFLSTDSLKKIGPGWKPVMYGYARSNPLSEMDPQGLEPISGAIAFGVGLVFDFGVQLYKYNTDQNFMPSVAELWVSGATAAAATEVAEYSGGFAIAVGATKAVGTVFSIASAALVNGGGNVIQQSVAKGIRNVDLDESSETVLFSSVSSGVSKLVPNIPLNVKNYPAAVNSYMGKTLLNEGVSAITGTALDAGKSYLTTRTATVAGPKAIAATSISTGGASPGSGGTTSSGSGGNTYTIQSGDTLSAIAMQNHTTVGSLAAINNISNPDKIRAGATIKLK